MENAFWKKDQLHKIWIENPCPDEKCAKYDGFRNKVIQIIGEAKKRPFPKV